MSALRGLAAPSGLIALNGGAATSFFRAMGMVGGALKNIATPGVGPFFFNGSVNVQADGAVLIDAAGAITNYVGGLPLTAAGALAIATAPPAYFSQGVGITASGRVAVI